MLKKVKKQMSHKIERWNTQDIWNVVNDFSNEEYLVWIKENQYMHRLRPINIKCVDFIRSKLGKQDYIWTGEFRFHVWENEIEGWRVLVNNTKGICFEVKEGFNKEQSLSQWYNFLVKLT